MAVLIRAIPRLRVLDLDKALPFYTGSLGFSTRFEYPGYAGVVRDGVEIHLSQCEDPALPKATSCKVEVSGIHALHGACERKGIVHPKGALTEQPWGQREFAVLDPDGNEIVFTEHEGSSR